MVEILEITHNSYLDSLQDEKEFETEYNSVEEYREKALRIQLKAKRSLDNLKKNSCENEIVTSENNRELPNNKSPKALCQRLPEVELYKFGGDLKDWLTFWNQFRNIHENVNLTKADKFHYLIQSTKLKSEARKIVESFPVIDENYPLAVESLTE
ncbi:uncharacterized protein, partial [Parasteatoda tepidariorum]|uniref:uncharacterized protein n=1 Tax=Parasteatoda tepidariorum TaxID=114398 RepID=UPI0039BD639A